MLLLVSTKASPVAQSSDSKGSSFDSCIGEPSCSSVLVVESLHFACELKVMVLRLQTLECIVRSCSLVLQGQDILVS